MLKSGFFGALDFALRLGERRSELASESSKSSPASSLLLVERTGVCVCHLSHRHRTPFEEHAGRRLLELGGGRTPCTLLSGTRRNPGLGVEAPHGQGTGWRRSLKTEGFGCARGQNKETRKSEVDNAIKEFLANGSNGSMRVKDLPPLLGRMQFADLQVLGAPESSQRQIFEKWWQWASPVSSKLTCPRNRGWSSEVHSCPVNIEYSGPAKQRKFSVTRFSQTL